MSTEILDLLTKDDPIGAKRAHQVLEGLDPTTPYPRKGTVLVGPPGLPRKAGNQQIRLKELQGLSRPDAGWDQKDEEGLEDGGTLWVRRFGRDLAQAGIGERQPKDCREQVKVMRPSGKQPRENYSILLME